MQTIELTGGLRFEYPDEGVFFYHAPGGSSLGRVFRERDLPKDPLVRQALILTLAGAPENIEGDAGDKPVTNKWASIGPVSEESPEIQAVVAAKGGADFVYRFYQYVLGTLKLSETQSCINVFSALGGLAIKEGWVAAAEPVTKMRVYKTNTGSISSLEVLVDPDGQPVYAGSVEQDGVKYSRRAPVIAGFNTPAMDKLLPTGHTVDYINDLPVTMIDFDMPVALLNYESVPGAFGFTGRESVAELQGNKRLWTEFLNPIRLKAAELMKIKNTASTPKLIIVMPPKSNGQLCSTYSFINENGSIHGSIGGMMAVGVAAAAYMTSVVAAHMPRLSGSEIALKVGHPSGAREFYVTGNGEGIFTGGRIESTAGRPGVNWRHPDEARMRAIYSQLLKAAA